MCNYRFPLLICIFFSFLVFSCASSKTIADLAEYERTPHPPQPVHVTITKKYSLLPTDCIVSPVSSLQLITAKFKKGTFSSPVFVEADTTKIYFSLMNAFGTSMGELLYTDGAISFDSVFFSGHLKPEYVVADFQFCYYNITEIAAALQKTNLRVTVETKENGTVEIRRIYNGMGKTARCVEKITRKDHYAYIENFYYKYSYTLEEAGE